MHGEAGDPPLLTEWDSERFRILGSLQEAPRNNGRVELAEDLHASGRLLAVKVMPKWWVCDSLEAWTASYPEETECPWRDIAITKYLSQVNFQCVCEFVGLFERQREGESEVCLAMAYSSGGDLFAWLESSQLEVGAEREAVIRPLMFEVMRAIGELHALGIAHGDMSLENVLLPGADEADRGIPLPPLRIIDFSASTGLRAVGTRGKPSYQAPEMHSNLEYDACAADVFSLGVMLFTLVVGNYPWRSTRQSVCPCWKYTLERGLPAYLARRKIKVGEQVVTLADQTSPTLVCLLQGLLSIDVATRLTLRDALAHTWFSEAGLVVA